MDRGFQTVLSRHRFDVDEYHRMMRAGIVLEGSRVELIDGEILEMSAIGTRHVSCVLRLTRTLAREVGDRALVSIQNPVRLDRRSEPEPDVVLLRPRDDDYAASPATPEDVLLLIEVADASLPFDREVKLPLYAAAGIREVWIVDLTSDAVEVYGEPGEDSYCVRESVDTGVITPVALPGLDLAIEDLLPPAA